MSNRSMKTINDVLIDNTIQFRNRSWIETFKNTLQIIIHIIKSTTSKEEEIEEYMKVLKMVESELCKSGDFFKTLE